MANYPASIPTFTNPVVGQNLGASTPPHSTQHIRLNDEVGAALAIIGVNPQGTGATLVARLNTADTLVGAASSQAASALSTATAGYNLAVTATSNAGTALTTAQGAIPKSIGSSKGQLIAFTASGTPVALVASADGLALVCDATSASGFKFATVSSSGSGASATHFLIASNSPTTSGDVVVTITTITAPYAVAVHLYNQSGTMCIPDSVIATATQFTVNVYSYLSTGTLAGTFGGVYIA